MLSMTDKTKSPAKKPGGWSAVRQELATWSKPALLALIKDLYAVSDVGRDLVSAQCQPGESGEATLEKYRVKIVDQFFPSRGFGKLKLGEARKAVRDYRKATGSLPGTAELLMTYVENGVKFTHDFGGVDERFYNSLESALNELAGLLRGAARQLYPELQDRLSRLKPMTSGIGWGFHDFIKDAVDTLEKDLRDG